MLIIGTGGLAKDVIASMEQDLNGFADGTVFFDNMNLDLDKLFEYYPIHHAYTDLEDRFASPQHRDFIVCIGNPLLRKRMVNQIKGLGGNLSHFVSVKTCAISPFTKISPGVVIQQGTIVSRNALLDEGVFINANVVVGHDVHLHEYVSVGPGAKILGYAEIGEFSYIGTNAVIMPGVKIGKKVRIGVGKIIEQDVPDNSKIM